MFEQIGRDRAVVRFTGADAGTGPLTWGQKAILQDMRDSGSQFNMGGMMHLPRGSTIEDAADRMGALMSRHAALRMRLGPGTAGQPGQEIAASGRADLDVLTIPDDAGPADAARLAGKLLDDWPLTRFDFHRDWPLRMAVIRHRGACLQLVWVLSHLAADGGAHLLLLADLLKPGPAGDARPPQILDIARSEQEPQLRGLSRRAMRYWESQLRQIPPQAFGEPVRPPAPGPRYWQARFSSPAAHLAMLVISGRTGTDASRVATAVIATAIGRAMGIHPLTVKVMVSNRFRPGLADVIAPIAQNSAVTVDAADASIHEVVARTRGASLTAGMRAYYDPDDLAEVITRLDAERGRPAVVTCRINDQRAMIMRAGQNPAPREVTAEQIRRRRAETSLTWLGPRENMHEQVNILIENRPDVVSLHMMWDQWSLTRERAEAVLRCVEDVAVDAALDPAARTGVPA